ncbi:hypothetical protein [Actinacidiphila bryophytorum]|nr:hypothetical protein [Actinacidiphila bryophytorum]MBM9438507.1 hypothetical protein [Actinacidiphila bryophytorum]MBN6543693.1 hypothetical protein [Actinacidiphila bryophytorum]
MTGLRSAIDGLPDVPALLLGPSAGADRALRGTAVGGEAEPDHRRNP